MNTKLFFILISLFFFTTLRGELIYSNPFSSQDSLKGWQVRPEASTSGGVLSFDLKKQTGGFPCIYRSLPPEKAAGKLIAISAEIKGSQLKRYQKKPFTGVKLQFLATADGKNIFAGPTLTKEGSYDWQTLRQVLYLPPNVQDLKLQIGMQGSTGRKKKKNHIGMKKLVTESADGRIRALKTMVLPSFRNSGEKNTGDSLFRFKDKGKAFSLSAAESFLPAQKESPYHFMHRSMRNIFICSIHSAGAQTGKTR